MKTDVLVIGGGPAGLSGAQYAARAGYSTLLIDPMGPGGQLLYIDEIENYPGTAKTSGYALSEAFEKQATEFGVSIEYMGAEGIEKNGDTYIVHTDSGEDIEARAIIIATGASHRHLGVPGEEEYAGRGVSYCATCDGPFFKDKSVVVCGGGDTALTDALYLSKLCSSVTIIHRRDSFRAQKALQDRLEKAEGIKRIMGATIASIDGDGKHVTGVTLADGRKIEADGVFIFVGTTPNSKAFEGVLETESGFIKTNGRMETSVPGIFAAGDVRTTTFRQVVTAAGDGAMAAHAADEYLENR